MTAGVPTAAPVQSRARVLVSEPAAAYRRLVLAVPGVGQRSAPGQFAAVAVGEENSAMLLRRAFSIHRAEGDELELIVAAHGPGTRWIASRAVGDELDVVAALGQPFRMPAPGTGVVLVGGGYGSAPLRWAARVLTARGCRVDVVVGAGDEHRLFDVGPLHEVAETVSVTTDDGSAGVPGRVTDVLPDVLAHAGSGVVMACGPMPMLRAVAEVARAAQVPSQLAVEESMACGVGICMTCVLPVRDDAGQTRMVRSCVEGPVFDGEAIRWDALTAAGSQVPADAIGAPR